MAKNPFPPKPDPKGKNGKGDKGKKKPPMGKGVKC